MVWVVVYKRNHRRVRVGGVLTPVFVYSSQAINFIKRQLGNSGYMMPLEVG
jgi:hypothetical protein